MKKVIVISIVGLIIVFGLITSYVDSARVRNSVEPKFVLKIVSDDGMRVTYWGLGYKVIRYPSVSSSEPYENNIGVKYGNWFMKYDVSDNDSAVSKYEVTEIENVSINIYDVSSVGATIIVRDTNVIPSVYGEWYAIEKEIDGKWYELKPLINNLAWITIGYIVDNNNEVNFVINWEEIYGKLPIGTYRILKKSHRQYIAVSFSILDNDEIVIDVNKFDKYMEKDEKVIYISSNMDDVYVTVNDSQVSLKDYINLTYQTFDDSIRDIVSRMTLYADLNDGGSKIYKSLEDDITVVKCNTVDGNKDIYVGDYLMKFDGELMCK